MHCPFCSETDTKVIDSRMVSEGSQVRRRRECPGCNERFTTFEAAELVMPHIVKRDGRRLPFDEDKLRYGIMKAIEKRPVAAEAIEASLAHILREIRATGEREVGSEFVGKLVMGQLRDLDKVAYLRFASVYFSFQDVNAFYDEIQRLCADQEPV